MPRVRYSDSVFLNAPFDEEYRELHAAIVFAVYDCGFVARSALEAGDSSKVRIANIYELIGASKYSISDISRTTLDPKHQLPRFNMPLELGIFLGAKRFGGRYHRNKNALILDRDRYRYQRFCSDIAGQDIRAHAGRPRGAIRAVREWLRASPDTRGQGIPGADYIYRRHRAFKRQLPKLCSRLSLRTDELTFVDYSYLIVAWIQRNPKTGIPRQ